MTTLGAILMSSLGPSLGTNSGSSLVKGYCTIIGKNVEMKALVHAIGWAYCDS
jgi:hypothetical protein